MLVTLAKTVLANLCCLLLLLQQPWYKGFTGTIAQTAPHQYTTYVQMRRGSTLSRRNQLRLVWSLTLRYTLTHSASSSSVGQQESGCTVLVILYNTVSLSLSRHRPIPKLIVYFNNQFVPVFNNQYSSSTQHHSQQQQL